MFLKVTGVNVKGEIYIHYKNGKEYIVENFCKIQVDNIWIDAVIYKENGSNNSNLYVRPTYEFLVKFLKDNK